MTDFVTCVFCRIIAGSDEASFVYRDGICSAFMDIAPIAEGHVLVAPDRHAERMSALSDDDVAHMMAIGRRIASAITSSGIRSDGVLFFLADGAAAGQEVPHIHLHVVPRYEGDGVRLISDAQPRDRQELEAVSSKIRAVLE